MEEKISFRNIFLKNAAEVRREDHLLEIEVSQNGGGLVIPCAQFADGQTLAVEIETLGVDFAPFYVFFYRKGDGRGTGKMQPTVPGEEQTALEPAFRARTGVKPGLKSTWTFEFRLLRRTGAPFRTPGRQKLDLTGQPCRIEEMDEMYLQFTPNRMPVHVRFSDMRLCEEEPGYFIEPRPLLDEMGQYISKRWKGKQHSVEEMTENMKKEYERSVNGEEGFGAKDWNRWGGWKQKKLCQGTGFFQTYFDGKRWWLADPEGFAFFSIGPDCVGTDREKIGRAHV